MYFGRVKRGRYHPADHMWSLSKTLREPALVCSTTELHAQAQGASLCSSIRETACHHTTSLGHSVLSDIRACMYVHVFMRLYCIHMLCTSICVPIYFPFVYLGVCASVIQNRIQCVCLFICLSVFWSACVCR